jgi:rod shape-determining protein MreC
LFKQGPSALTQLVFYGVFGVFLMVADARLHITQPLHSALATAIYPLEWLARQPVDWLEGSADYVSAANRAQALEEQTRQQLTLQSAKTQQVNELLQENAKLRELLDLSQRFSTTGQAAQILYDAADPFTHRAVIDRGQLKKIALGSPVIDEKGVVGQVTRVDLLTSEVTLVIDKDFAIPVLNVRTGERSVAEGDPQGAGLELRFVSANADVQVGDELSTSGVDGVYPPGLSVAKVDKIDRRGDAAFARVHCVPLSGVTGARHVLVVTPLGAQVPARPAPVAPPSTRRKGARDDG